MSKIVRRSMGAGAAAALFILIGKIIGAAYKIPLINVLGAEGMGDYQLIFPVYAAAIALTSGSSSIIISRNVAARKADPELKDNVGNCILYTLLLSLTAAAIMCALSKVTAQIQGRENIRYCYYIIAPSVVFVGMSSCLKGIFTGEGKVSFPAACQLFEQGIKAAVGILLSYELKKRSLIYGVMGAVAGVSLSELFSLMICLLIYAADKDKYRPVLNLKSGFFKENKFITAHGIILPLSTLADGILIVKFLSMFGSENASALYGIMTGSVNTVINMPIVIALSAAVTIIPAVSYGYALNNAQRIKEKSSKCVKYVFLITCACFFGIFILAEDIIKILFSSLSTEEYKTAALLMRVSSLNVITASLSGVYSSILQAVDESGICLKYTGILCILRVAVMIPLIYRFSITGAALSWTLYYSASFLIGAAYHCKFLGKDIKLVKNNGKILLCGVIMSVSILPFKAVSNIYVRVSACIILGAAVYFGTALILKVFERKGIRFTSSGRVYGAAERREKWRNSK